MVHELLIRDLANNCRLYDGLTKLIVSSKNRLQALNPDAKPEHQEDIESIAKVKKTVSRRINALLENWPVWTNWMVKIPGIGPLIGGNMIMLYYYRFVPICKKCDTPLIRKDNTNWCTTCEKGKLGEGLNKFKVEEKDFPKISAWWKYCGRHVEDGKMPKFKTGQQCDWSPRGRLINYHFGEQVNHQADTHLYKAFFLKTKKKVAVKHPEESKGHVHNMARMITGKLFLAHFWAVARTLDGKYVTPPYGVTMLGHPISHVIHPYYYDGKIVYDHSQAYVSKPTHIAA